MSLAQILSRDFFNNEDLFTTLPDRLISTALNELSIPNDKQYASWAPAVDIKEEDTQFVLSAELPGISSKEIDITFENNSLTIKGEKKSKVSKDDNYHRVETGYGSFVRTFTFPKNIDSEAIKANNVDGVLEIIIPKKEAKKPKKIEIS